MIGMSAGMTTRRLLSTAAACFGTAYAASASQSAPAHIVRMLQHGKAGMYCNPDVVICSPCAQDGAAQRSRVQADDED